MPHLTRDSHVFVLHLGQPGDTAETGTDNRFSPDWLSAAHALLDEVEASTGPAAVVTTGTGKFYSNGFEPERFAGPPAAVSEYLLAGQRLFARVLAAGLPTVAAVNGHAFGGGALLAIAHDVRLMRADRGYLCLPEISLGLVIPAGMMRLVTARLPAQAAHEAMLTGRRYSAPQALAAGIVDGVADEGELRAEAVELAEQLAPTRGPVLAAMKQQLYAPTLAALAAV